MTSPFFGLGLPPKAASRAPLEAGVSPPPRPPSGRVARAIWGHLRGIFPRAEQPKKIALTIREKSSTVRKEIVRMEANGSVVNVDASGWYRAWADPGLLARVEQPPPQIHALQIVSPVPLDGWLPPPRGALQAKLRGDKRWVASEAGGDFALRKDVVRGREVRFQSYSAGTMLISVSASSQPISYSEWETFWPALAGLCQGLGVDLESPMARLVNVEFNVDWSGFFMSGVKRLKMTEFNRTWAQVYQKHRDALRMELRVAPVELSVAEAAQAILVLAQGSQLDRAVPPRPVDPFSPEVA